MILAILIIVLPFIIAPKLVFAISPPTQISPTNNATVSSSKLTWESPSYALYPNNPYRIQVDDNSDFSSVYRDYYTKNTYYTPVLTQGNWYWRIKAKDSSATWSDWSSTWSFVLSSTITIPSPTPSPSTTNPSSTPSVSSSSSTSSNSSSFTISNLPSQSNSDESFSVSVNLSLPDKPNASLYLKGAFRHPDKPTNYFGLTKVGSSWIKNGSSYVQQFPATTDPSGQWSGTLQAQPDPEDSGFSGTGSYLFKVGRYTSAGSGPTWSNEATITINQVNPEDSSSVGSTVTTTPPSSNKTSDTSIKNSGGKLQAKLPAVAGIGRQATTSTNSSINEASASVENNLQRGIGFLPIIGIFLIIIGLCLIGYIFIKNRVKY